MDKQLFCVTDSNLTLARQQEQHLWHKLKVQPWQNKGLRESICSIIYRQDSCAGDRSKTP